VRNDEIAVADIDSLAPERIVISPGPCTPNEAGISMAVIEAYAGEGPTLKRFRPRARGRATRIDKRTSHITIVVGDRREEEE